jgi:hypothetical protein
MRLEALRLMRVLARFRPRLIGSVCTGHVRAGSDKSFAETSYQAVGSRSGEVEYLLLDTFAQK